MKQCLFILFLVFLTVSSVDAEVLPKDSIEMKKNSVYLEFMGLGILYSINYDHLFMVSKEPAIGIGTRAGFSIFVFELFGDNSLITTIPLEGYLSIGHRFCFELGLSNTFVFEDNMTGTSQAIRLGGKIRGRNGPFFTFGSGIRWHNPTGDLAPLLYIGVGYAF
jgi:hypothetical protein